MTDQKPIINSLFGIPNRVVLMTFAVLKSIIDCFVMYKFGQVTLNAIDGYYVLNQGVFLATFLPSSLFIWDVPFMIALLDGAYEKSRELIKFTYSYSIPSLTYAIGGASASLYYLYTDNISLIPYIDGHKSATELWLIHIGVFGSYSLIHLLMILLMKSEMIIITNNRDQILQSVFQHLAEN